MKTLPNIVFACYVTAAVLGLASIMNVVANPNVISVILAFIIWAIIIRVVFP